MDNTNKFKLKSCLLETKMQNVHVSGQLRKCIEEWENFLVSSSSFSMHIVYSIYHACIGYCKNDINIIDVISTICEFLLSIWRRRPICYTLVL